MEIIWDEFVVAFDPGADKVEMDDAARGMVPLAKAMPDREVAIDEVLRGLASPSAEPWVVLDGGWWKAS